MWDPQLRPLRPEASLAGTFTHLHLSMTVFVGRSVKDRPAAPCLSKKHKTEHLTTFFALSRQGLTHTHTHTHPHTRTRTRTRTQTNTELRVVL